MEIEGYEKELIRLTRALDKEKDRSSLQARTIESTVQANIKALKLKPIPKPNISTVGKGAETAVAVLADWQLGKHTSSYDLQVAEERVEQYTKKVIELTNVQRLHHPVKDVEVWVLGDIVEGEGIFAGQSHVLIASLFEQVFVGNRLMMNFFNTMLANFENVKVRWVIGNHGRIGGHMHKEYNPETNMDRVLGEMLKNVYETIGEKRIKFSVPKGLFDSWYDISDLGGYRTLLIHGDQLNSLNSVNNLQRKIQGWQTGAIDIPANRSVAFNDVYCGHFHHEMKYTFNNITLRVSGSPESDNDYARKDMASVAQPSQPLLFVKPGYGPTAEYRVNL